MSVFFPQGVVQLRAVLEDFGYNSNPRLQQPYTWTVVARRITVNINNYKEADTFTCEIDYKNFPLDPRIIRSLGVLIFIEDKKQIFDISGNKNLDLIKPGINNIVFQGFADSDKIELNEQTRTVTLEGRDFTSLLIDREYLGDPIVTTTTLDKIIRGLLDQLTETRIDPANPGVGLLIDNQTGETLPILANLTGAKEAFAGLRNTTTKKTYWDIIQELISNTGLICYVSLDRLVITKPRNLYNRQKSKVFIYGRNVKSLEYERKLGRQKGFNVRVVGLNFETKELISANIPEEATEAWAQDIGIKRAPIMLPVAHAPTALPENDPNNQANASLDLTSRTNKGRSHPQPLGAQQTLERETAPYFTFRVKNITTKAQCIEIGQRIFEELGRQEIEGKIVTREMKIYSPEVKGADAFFNATQFEIGIPIEVRIDQGDLEGIPTKLRPAARNQDENDTPQQRDQRMKTIAARLKQRGYDPQVADALAESLTTFDTPFYTKEVELKLDRDDGFEMTISFINFIEIPANLANGSTNG